MTNTRWIRGLMVVVAISGCGVAGAAEMTPASAGAAKAGAVLKSASGSKVTGKATFTEFAGKVTMKVTVHGLTPGVHAIHLHEKPDCSAPDASSAGGHWNPQSMSHGQWGHAPFHEGDIGNLTADAKGNATMTLTTDMWKLGDGSPNDVVGHAVVVHEKQDDFTTQPTGNAGGRVACGVIER